MAVASPLTGQAPQFDTSSIGANPNRGARAPIDRKLVLFLNHDRTEEAEADKPRQDMTFALKAPATVPSFRRILPEGHVRMAARAEDEGNPSNGHEAIIRCRSGRKLTAALAGADLTLVDEHRHEGENHYFDSIGGTTAAHELANA